MVLAEVQRSKAFHRSQMSTVVDLANRRQNSVRVELYEYFGLLMDGRREAHAVIISVMDCVEELHEDIAKDMELLEAFLINC